MEPDRHGQIFHLCLEVAEMAYLRALDEGMVDPVVKLTGDMPSRPGEVRVSFSPRERVLADLDRVCAGAADQMRRDYDPARPFVVVIATAEGVSPSKPRPAPS